MLTKKELADYLRVNPATIDNYRRKGMPVKLLTAKKVLFDLDDCLKWIEETYRKKED
jgi:phage terminase Nu1 subunit (DNA packaging protein)